MRVFTRSFLSTHDTYVQQGRSFLDCFLARTRRCAGFLGFGAWRAQWVKASDSELLRRKGRDSGSPPPPFPRPAHSIIYSRPPEPPEASFSVSLLPSSFCRPQGSPTNSNSQPTAVRYTGEFSFPFFLGCSVGLFVYTLITNSFLFKPLKNKRDLPRVLMRKTKTPARSELNSFILACRSL